MGVPPDRPAVRLAELVAALSLGIDLGFGQPMEHVLRQCIIATRLADLVGLDEHDRAGVYYTSLLINVGCHTDAHEQAKWFGDDIDLKADKYLYEPRTFREVVAALRRFGSGHPPLQRVQLGAEFALHGRQDLEGMVVRHASLAGRLAEGLGLSEVTCDALRAAYEQWDGKGWPGELSGDDVPIASRIAVISEYVEVTNRVHGAGAARSLVRRRAGAQFDPALAELLAARTDDVLGDLDGLGTWGAVIDAEPALRVVLTEDQLDAALMAIANFVDLKSPFTLGHSSAVADLAAGAATGLGVEPEEVKILWRAGLVHGLGRLGVSNQIWDRPGPLAPGDWERVRLQPYLTARMLRQSAALAPLGALASQHRERLDGSGYPGGLAGPAIGQTARILAVTDAYQSMREPRPHRPALTAGAASAVLAVEVRAGRLDGDAVDAVLVAAGHRVGRRRQGPAGLTAREVDVLRLLARGMPNKKIAAELGIAPKTVRNHVEHIYTKTGASSRVTASLFAMEHGLFSDR